MDRLVKLPGLELSRWAKEWTWDRLFAFWRENGMDGIVLPLTINDQLDNLSDLPDTIVRMAKAHDLQVWCLFQVLNNPDFSQLHPAERPVRQDAKPIHFPRWFAPICPSSTAYREFFLTNLQRLLPGHSPTGFLIDYLRIPYFWEEWGTEVETRDWPPFCYCHRCLSRFEQEQRREPHQTDLHSWSHWQASLLMDWFDAIYRLLHSRFPFAKIALQILPIKDRTTGQLAPEWLGQDLARMERRADFLSPLVYDRILDWPADSVISFLVELMVSSRLPVLPAFQISATRYDRRDGSVADLAALLRRLTPLKLPAVTLFHGRDLLEKQVLEELKA